MKYLQLYIQLQHMKDMLHDLDMVGLPAHNLAALLKVVVVVWSLHIYRADLSS